MAYAVIERDTDFESYFGSVVLNTVRIENYIKEIESEFFRNKQNEIWRVIFNGMTTLQNVVCTLTNLTSLEILEFRSVSLDQYFPLTSSSLPILNVPRLLLIKLSSSPGKQLLSKSERILLHFLTHRINTPALASLEVHSTNRSPTRWSHAIRHTDELNEVLRTQTVCLPMVLLQFMAKNAATLTDVKLDRNSLNGFLPPGSEALGSDQVASLEQIQLRSIQFQVDTVGIEALLKAQTKLENLTCDDVNPETEVFSANPTKPNISLIESELSSAIHTCILNCAPTLYSIKLFGVIPTASNNPAVTNYKTLKLSTFQNCTSLRSLKVDISNMPSSTFQMDASSIPDCLSSIILKVDRVFPKELLLLAEVISNAVSLRQFTIKSNSEYQVNYDCMTMLLQGNDLLRDIQLENAKLSEDFSASQLQNLLNRAGDPSNNRYWACEIRPRGVFFEKWVIAVE